MKITLDLPDPKFQVGDVVERPHEYGSIFLVVSKVQANGMWSGSDAGSGLSCSAMVGGGHYACAAQEGSTFINPSRHAIRPGKVFIFDIREMDKWGRKAEWDKPIVEPDTEENVDERQAAWMKPAAQPEGNHLAPGPA